MNHTWKKLALFAGGVLFGTAGIDILKSRDAKKLYTHTTAAVLRAKDCVMTTVTRTKENCGDILADARPSTRATPPRPRPWRTPLPMAERQRCESHDGPVP